MRTPRHRVLLSLAAWLACGDDSGSPTPVAEGSGDATSEGSSSAADAGSSSAADDSSSGTGAHGCGTSEPGDGAVLTAFGPVVGTAGDGVDSFLGIPYATPPLGALRWQPPIDPQCWSQPLVADAFGPECAQLQSEDGPLLGDEDCLTLNVWAPQAAGPHPVMVFLHGGGHTIGSGSDPLFDGTLLARERSVVVVTLNYRLGALGYLADASLAVDDPRGVSGNYGLLDQIHALRWVDGNIAAFGGDPERTLLFGESAGAVSTCAVVGSPDADGLYTRALVESGTCSFRTAASYEADVTAPWIAASGCADDADVAACLRAMSVQDVLTTPPVGFPSVSALGQTWSAFVDGVTLPASTLDRLRSGALAQLPLVVGSNAQETARDVPTLTEDAYVALVQASFGPYAELVLAQYPVADYADPTAAYVALSSDAKFVCGARRAVAAARDGGGSSVFRYHFSYDGYEAPRGSVPAAFHGLELVYVFGNFASLFPPPLVYQPNADDETMAALLGGAWAAFADTGSPSTASLQWPEYSSGDDPFAQLDVPPATGDGVRTAQCDFWDGLIPG
ncbi:MAG: carboxylesterase family protein [Nannocystaceae bacterium]|nr:carboxylesterase family protein [Nannocystaceae bacterium]